MTHDNGNSRLPLIEYMSAAHPEWQAQEMDYVLSQARRGVDLPEPRVDGAHPDAIDEEGYLERLRDPATRDAAICELIEEVGPDVVWPELLFSAFACGRVAGLRDEIRAVVRQRITSSWVLARHGAALADRQDAHAFLLAVGHALAGDQRGLRDRVVLTPLNVRKFYSRYIFRATKALELLRVWPWERTLASKIRVVATACDFLEEELRTLLLTDQEERRPALRVDQCGELAVPWLQEHARTWTGRKFGITEQTVANILAPSGVRGSSRSSRAHEVPLEAPPAHPSTAPAAKSAS
jgi:hypothetical protein